MTKIDRWAQRLDVAPDHLAGLLADPDSATVASTRIAASIIAERPENRDTTIRVPKFALTTANDPKVISDAIRHAKPDVLATAADRTELIARAAHDRIRAWIDADHIAVLGTWRLGEDRLASELERRLISFAAELVAPKPPAEWCALWAVPRTYRALCEAWQPDEHEHPLPALQVEWLDHLFDPIYKGTSMVPVSVAPRETQARLIDLTPQAQQPKGQLALPTFAHRYSALPWLLEMYEFMRGPYNTRGKGAPITERLTAQIMTRAPLAQRKERKELSIPASELVRWVWPNGWSQAAQRWDSLTEALGRIDQWRIPTHETDWRPVAVWGMPRSLQDRCVIELRLPDTTEGPRIDVDLLSKYGLVNTPTHRAYLASACIIDNSARNGQPITRKSLQSSDRLRRFVRPMTAHDLARTIDGNYDRRNRGMQYKQRDGALKAYERLADDGVIDLMKTGSGQWRVLGINRNK